jgi:hypothetical protein
MKRLLACICCAFAFQATAAAHVLDEYVEAAQITLAPDGVRVELRLTPGVEVAGRVFRMIDLDGDEQISPAEEQAYARRVLQDIALEVDGRRAPLALTGGKFPSLHEMNEGVGAIRLNLTAEADLRAAGDHQLAFRNDHLPKLSVYLVNTLIPSTNKIKISEQTRDPLQREMRLSFNVNPYVIPHVTLADTHRLWPWTGVLILCLGLVLLFSQWKHLRRYLRRPNDEKISDSPARQER